MHTFKIMLFCCWKVNLPQSHIYFHIVVGNPVSFWLEDYSDLFVGFVLEVEVEELSDATTNANLILTGSSVEYLATLLSFYQLTDVGIPNRHNKQRPKWTPTNLEENGFLARLRWERWAVQPRTRALNSSSPGMSVDDRS